MGIPVKLEVFEGPLDLLLHLIDMILIDMDVTEGVDETTRFDAAVGVERQVALLGTFAMAGATVFTKDWLDVVIKGDFLFLGFTRY